MTQDASGLSKTNGVASSQYAHDNQDRLAENQNLSGPGQALGSWITGFLTWTVASDNTSWVQQRTTEVPSGH